jgi:hypothetical protein
MSDLLDEIFDKLDYAQRYEDSVWGRCPFHSDSRPSFMVHEDRYYCQACGAQGKTKDLLDKLSGHIPQPAPDYFHNPFTRWLKDNTLPNILKGAWENLKQHPSAYLRDRCISYEWQIKLGMGMRDDWITFPIRNENNKIIGAVARAGQTNTALAKYVVPNGQDPNMIYVPDWELFKASDIIYATFGILDAVSLVICGAGAFSTTNGKRLNDVSALDKVRKRIIFLPDKMEEGEAKKIAARLGWRGAVAKINYPDDCKDPNDIYCYSPRMLMMAVGTWKRSQYNEENELDNKLELQI